MVWQHWLGLAKSKNVFRSTLDPSNKLLWNFKISYLTKFSTNWLTNYVTDQLTNWFLQPSICNLRMERFTGLISSLLDVASSQDVPFCQLQQSHSKHHGATFVFLYSSCSSSFHWQCYVLIYNSTKWLSTGFSEVTWIHYTEVSDTVVRSIAKNEA